MDLDNISENTEIYEDTEDYIILDNEENIPVIMWKDKDVVRDLKISRIMKKAIQTVGEEKYGRGNLFIDRFQSGSEIWNNFIYYIKYSAEILLITAMSAVGFNTKLSRFKNLGLKPFYLGFIAALSVGVVSFIVIYFLV